MERFLNTHNGGVVGEEYWTSRDGKNNLDTLLKKKRENYSCDLWVGRLESLWKERNYDKILEREDKMQMHS